VQVLNYWLYDSFTDVPFEGHVAAIVEVDGFLEKEKALKVVRELCQTVTCFFYKKDDNVFVQSYSSDYSLWPINHGLIAVAHHCFKEKGEGFLVTDICSLKVVVADNKVSIYLPKEQNMTTQIPDRLNQAFDIMPVSVREFGKTCIVELRTAEEVAELKPDFNRIAKMDHYDRIVITAEDSSSECDYVCRYFAPKHGINENYASLYIQTFLPIFWQENLQKDEMSFEQLSSRKGYGKAQVLNDYVVVTASACEVFKGGLSIL
jgi:predicted PhzF superfamily epimerase YddE/YHI9